MPYLRQKKQSRFYWAEIGFMLLGLLGLQPAIFSSFLSTTPTSSTTYSDPYHSNASYPTLESLKEWAAPHLASLIAHSPYAGPIQTQQGWAPVPVSMTNVPSTAPNYAASPAMQYVSPTLSQQQWQQNNTYPNAAQQQAAYMAQLNNHPANHSSNWQNSYGTQGAFVPNPQPNQNQQHNYSSYNSQPNYNPSLGNPSWTNPSYSNQAYSNQAYANPSYATQAYSQWGNQSATNPPLNNQLPYTNPQYGNPGSSNYNSLYSSPQNNNLQYNAAPFNNQGYPSNLNQGNGGWNNSWNSGGATHSAAAPWPNTFGYNNTNNGNNPVGNASQWSSSYPYIASPNSTQQSFTAGNNGNWQRYQPPTNSHLVR